MKSRLAVEIYMCWIWPGAMRGCVWVVDPYWNICPIRRRALVVGNTGVSGSVKRARWLIGPGIVAYVLDRDILCRSLQSGLLE